MSYRAASVGAYNAAANDAAARGAAAPFAGVPSEAAQRRGSSPGAERGGGGEASPSAEGRAREGHAGGRDGRSGEAPPNEDAAAEWGHVAFASLTASRLAKLRAGRDGAGEGAAAEAGERSVRGGGDGRGSWGRAGAPQSPPTPTPHSSGGQGGSPSVARTLFRRRCGPRRRGARLPAALTRPPLAHAAPRSFYAPDDGLTLRARLHFTLDEPSYSPLVRGGRGAAPPRRSGACGRRPNSVVRRARTDARASPRRRTCFRSPP